VCLLALSRPSPSTHRFYGLKDSLLLRDATADGKRVDPAFRPDWSQWATVDRTEVQDAAKRGGQDKAEAAKEVFDPVIIGPWMDLWDLETDVRGIPNQHIDTYIATDEKDRDLASYQYW
jgi:hypothetical protein